MPFTQEEFFTGVRAVIVLAGILTLVYAFMVIAMIGRRNGKGQKRGGKK